MGGGDGNDGNTVVTTGQVGVAGSEMTQRLMTEAKSRHVVKELNTYIV